MFSRIVQVPPKNLDFLMVILVPNASVAESMININEGTHRYFNRTFNGRDTGSVYLPMVPGSWKGIFLYYKGSFLELVNLAILVAIGEICTK